MTTDELSQRYAALITRIRKSEDASGRPENSVVLIAVSKTYPPELIQALYDLGHRDFGESRLQEAEPKVAALPKDIRWHFIGPIQSNKAKRIGNHFSVLHTLSTLSQLPELEKIDRPVEALVQVNVSREPQKSGLLPEELPNLLGNIRGYSKIFLRGLMTIPQANVDPRQAFQELALLSRNHDCGPWLSMGMSDDFELAIAEGATHVRIGTALFGERSTSALR